MGLFDGKVVVITGAGGGIGRAHALAFAREGASVVVNDLGGTRDGSGQGSSMADQVVAEIQAMGGKAAANYDNVALMEGAERLIKTAVDNFGGIDVLVNNAGILRDKTLVKMEEPMWDAVIAVHLKGTFCCSQVAARRMVEQGRGGRIVNTTSVAGLMGNFGQANYSAAKAGIYGFTLTTAMELRKAGITVNAVAPIAKTRMTEDINVIGEELKAEHISPMVLFLASDKAADVTGGIFGVHGPEIFAYKMIRTPGVTKEGEALWSVAEIQGALGRITAEKVEAPAPAAAAPAAAPVDPLVAAFGLIPQAFAPEKASGKKFNIFWDVQGGTAHSVILADNTLRVAQGKEGTPTCTVTASAETVLNVFSGKMKAEQAFMAGKIKATNIGDMMTFGQVIDMKKAKELAEKAASAPAPAPAAAPAAAAASVDPLVAAFGLIPQAFAPEKASGKKFNIFWDVQGGTAHSVILADNTLRVAQGKEGSPTCTVTASAETVLNVFSGKMKAEQAFMAGKIKATNIGDMMTFGQVIDMKKAKELAEKAAAAPAPAAAPAAAAAPTGDPLAAAFGLIPNAFAPEKAAGKKFNIFWDVQGGTAHSVILADGQLKVVKGKEGTPSCTVTADAETVLNVFSGKTKAEQAFMAGKIKATNIGDMMTFGQVIDMKKAKALAEQAASAPAPAAAAPASAAAPAVKGGSAVSEAFLLLPEGLKADKVGDWKATLFFDVKGTDGWTLSVAGGKATSAAGKVGTPDATITISSSELALDILSGSVDAQKAFMQGKIMSSNLGTLMKFAQLFKFEPREMPKGPDRRPFIGKSYEGSLSMATDEHMLAYARSVSEDNAAYLDVEKGIIAHPIFPVRFFIDGMYKAATDPDLALDVVRLVHGEQDMRFHRPIRPGDLLNVRTRLKDVQEKESGTTVTVNMYAYVDGERAVDADGVLFIRSRGKNPSFRPGGAPAEKAPAVEKGAVVLTHTFTVDKDQATRYAEASLDKNPIHLDNDAARAAGLPGIILHGLCTMAMSTKGIVNQAVDSDPLRLKRYAVRFAKPVFPGDTLTLEAWVSGHKDGVTSYGFEVKNQDGVVVVSNGIAEVLGAPVQATSQA